MAPRHRGAQSKRQMKKTTRPLLEQLEGRVFLSVSLASHGLLSIVGTDSADSINIRTAKTPGLLSVSVNGERTLYNLSDVKGIRVDALGGNDSVVVMGIRGPVNIPMTIFGGDGNDSLSGGSGNDFISGQAGDDLLYGGVGSDTLNGDAGNDTITAGAGDDSITGGKGNDDIATGAGADTNVGGAGHDHIFSGTLTAFPTSTYIGLPKSYTPQQIRSGYGFGDLEDPNYTNRGKGQAIAIVDAFHTPTARRDLDTFSRTFGLPLTNKFNFQQVGEKGIPTDENWTGETLLDIEWAHAIAPEARIILVEARSQLPMDMATAIAKASDILNTKFGGGVVSMSFRFELDPTDNSIDAVYEGIFGNPVNSRITYVAAAGDTGGTTNYPGTSPNVVSVGGTKLFLDPFGNRIPGVTNVAVQQNQGGQGGQGQNNNQVVLPIWNNDLASDCGTALVLIPGGEAGWWEGGGGASTIFPIPDYQQNSFVYTDPFRGVPDVAWSGNPDPRVAVNVFNSFGDGGRTGWFGVGGTSAGSPQFAALIALANQLRAKAHKAPLGNTVLPRIYGLGGTGPDAYFNDITVHGNGPIAPCPDGTFVNRAGPGWDTSTGWGSPNAQSLIPALADQKRISFTNGTIEFRGRLTQNQINVTPPVLRSLSFKGNSQVQGLYTLNLDPVHMRQIFTGGGSGSTGGTGGSGGTGGGTGSQIVTTIDLFGMDSQTGRPLPDTVDRITGLVTIPGTPITLHREPNNVVTGLGFYLLTVANPNNTGGGTQGTLTFGTVKFVGTINKGRVEGEYYAINPDGSKIKQVFNRQGVAIVSGTFEG